uniref:Uncharacterized protein n=1 Tax=Arundo donax TaxID=35708 RepID=A0A0A8YU08_ARUDO
MHCMYQTNETMVMVFLLLLTTTFSRCHLLPMHALTMEQLDSITRIAR